MLHLLVITGFGVLNLFFSIERCLYDGLVYQKIVEYSESERGYYIYKSKVFNMCISVLRKMRLLFGSFKSYYDTHELALW